MARKMRAVVLTMAGDIMSAREQRVPVPELGRGEVLVQVQSSPILPIDLTLMYGILGHEGSGTVVESGGGTLGTSLIGKRVYLFHQGLWAEYVSCPATSCVQLLDEITFDQGANMINPLTVLEFREIIRKGGHRACAQTAANSALGKMFIRLCQNDGVALINIVRSERSAQELRNRGAENVLNSSDPGFDDACLELCTRLNVTVAFDAVAGDVTRRLKRCLRTTGGVVHIYGNLEGTHWMIDIIVTSWIARKSTEEREAIFHTVQRELTTTFQTDIAGHYPLDQIRDALRSHLSNMSAGKVLIHPNRK